MPAVTKIKNTNACANACANTSRSRREELNDKKQTNKKEIQPIIQNYSNYIPAVQNYNATYNTNNNNNRTGSGSGSGRSPIRNGNRNKFLEINQVNRADLKLAYLTEDALTHSFSSVVSTARRY